MIYSSREIKIFEKSLEGVLQNRGGNCDSQWWEMMFFGEFFPKAATQRGVVLDITPVGEQKFF